MRVRFAPALPLASLLALTTALGLLAGIAPTPARAEDEGGAVEVTLDRRGLGARTADGLFTFKVGGRLHADGNFHIGDTPASTPFDPGPPPVPGVNRGITDGTEIRRARLIAQATAYGEWAWTGEVDFADNETSIKDFTLAFTGFEGLTISVGHQKQPYSLAIEMSSNDINFTERSIDHEAIVPIIDRAIGIRLDANGEKWFVAAGFYGESVEPRKDSSAEGFGAAGKVVFTPIRSDDAVVHLGFRGAYRRPESGNESLSLSTETTRMSDYRVLRTGMIEDIENIFLYGPEAAFSRGPVTVFGEYNRQILQRSRGKTLEFEGGHIGAAWSLTGESWARAYRIDSGEFKGLIPDENFSLARGGIGAWELAARYAYLNLNDGGPSDPFSVSGGRQQVLTGALNWWPNRNIRFMFNYNYILQADSSGANAVSAKEAEGLHSFTVRAQVNF